ncbi:pentapeptide repeat-containing protein [Clostridium sp. UBA871]|uniref:pentapeptide repeat-containing protein n=1 Tax=Clostridium sp. UBA871 TaxID=1946380 RepID=UPI003217788E
MSTNNRYCKRCYEEEFYEQIKAIYKEQPCKIIETEFSNIFLATLEYGFIRSRVLVRTEALYDGIYDANEIIKLNRIRESYDNESSIKISEIHLIVNGNLNIEIVDLTKRYNIKVCFEDEIVNMIMDLNNFFCDFSQKYEENPIREHFIDINTIEGDSLVYTVDEFINNEDENALLILGEYGCGKTSFCLDLTYNMIQEYKIDSTKYIPIIIYLREYIKAISMDDMITNFFINKYNIINGNIRNFKKLLEYGKILLIFDGFDEIAKRVDYDVKYRVFNEICKYASNNTKILLTCRPNYFQDRKEYENIFKDSYLHFEPDDFNDVKFSEVQVGELNRDQIIGFIKSYEKELKQENIRINELNKIIYETHDLLDLAKRPFLLNIIIKTLPTIINNTKKITGKDIKIKINAVELYENYTEQWLRREDAKGKTLIKAKDKQFFCENLAFEMFIKDENSISYDNLPDAIAKYFDKISDITEIDYFSHDIKSCSFLAADENGNYTFIHKSFMEFFVAKVIIIKLNKISNKIDKNITDIYYEIEEILGESYISTEICLFINDFLEKKYINKQKIVDLLQINIDRMSDIAILNSISILSKTNLNIGSVLSKLVESKKTINLEGVDLSYSIIKDIDINQICFDNASFYKARILNVNFSSSSFINTSFNKSKIEKVDFSDQVLENTDWSYADILKSLFRGSSLCNAKLQESKFKECDFLDADFSDMDLNGGVDIYECNNMDTVIGLPYELEL